MTDKKTEALRMALEAGFAEAGSSTDEYYEAGIENIVRLVELAKHKALADPAKQEPGATDTLYLLRRLLSNQHTLTGPEFRAELEKIVADARQSVEATLPAGVINEIDFDGDKTTALVRIYYHASAGDHIYTSPPAPKQWVGLTEDDFNTDMFSITSLGVCDIATIKSIAKDVEAKLKEKNHG